jgi:hypothetical protein
MQCIERSLAPGVGFQMRQGDQARRNGNQLGLWSRGTLQSAKMPPPRSLGKPFHSQLTASAIDVAPAGEGNVGIQAAAFQLLAKCIGFFLCHPNERQAENGIKQ